MFSKLQAHFRATCRLLSYLQTLLHCCKAVAFPPQPFHQYHPECTVIRKIMHCNVFWDNIRGKELPWSYQEKDAGSLESCLQPWKCSWFTALHTIFSVYFHYLFKIILCIHGTADNWNADTKSADTGYISSGIQRVSGFVMETNFRKCLCLLIFFQC